MEEPDPIDMHRSMVQVTLWRMNSVPEHHCQAITCAIILYGDYYSMAGAPRICNLRPLPGALRPSKLAPMALRVHRLIGSSFRFLPGRTACSLRFRFCPFPSGSLPPGLAGFLCHMGVRPEPKTQRNQRDPGFACQSMKVTVPIGLLHFPSQTGLLNIYPALGREEGFDFAGRCEQASLRTQNRRAARNMESC